MKKPPLDTGALRLCATNSRSAGLPTTTSIYLNEATDEIERLRADRAALLTACQRVLDAVEDGDEMAAVEMCRAAVAQATAQTSVSETPT